MKGKEIVSRILANLTVEDTTVDAAFETELLADILRFQQTVKERNIDTSSRNEVTKRIALEAWFRLCNEYNVKWNSLCLSLMEKDGRFIHPNNAASFLYGKDVFVHVFVNAVSKDTPDDVRQQMIDYVLKTSSGTRTKWDVAQQVQRERDYDAAQSFWAAYNFQGGLR